MNNKWTPKSWRLFPIKQQPNWNQDDSYYLCIKKLASFPPLVFAGEVKNLTQHQNNIVFVYLNKFILQDPIQ